MTTKELREKLKDIQTQLDDSRRILRAKRNELLPLETQISLLTKERDRLNGELITALSEKQSTER